MDKVTTPAEKVLSFSHGNVEIILKSSHIWVVSVDVFLALCRHGSGPGRLHRIDVKGVERRQTLERSNGLDACGSTICLTQ
jgi:hypothetical protein